MVKDIISKITALRKDTPTSSYEVIGVIIEVLIKDGFTEVLKSFIDYME